MPLPVAAALLGLLGAALGSFILTVVDRLEHDQKWWRGRSRCERCRRTLQAWELIPIVSAVLLRNRCRTCSANFGYWHLGVELGLAILFVLAVWLPPELGTDSLALRLAIISLLAALFVSDVRYGSVPDQISVPAILLVFLAAALQGQIATSLLGAGVGCLVFALQYIGSKGRWVGSGDIRLGLLIGALAGWPYVLATLLLAYVGGALIALILLAIPRVGRTYKLP